MLENYRENNERVPTKTFVQQLNAPYAILSVAGQDGVYCSGFRRCCFDRNIQSFFAVITLFLRRIIPGELEKPIVLNSSP